MSIQINELSSVNVLVELDAATTGKVVGGVTITTPAPVVPTPTPIVPAPTMPAMPAIPTPAAMANSVSTAFGAITIGKAGQFNLAQQNGPSNTATQQNLAGGLIVVV